MRTNWYILETWENPREPTWDALGPGPLETLKLSGIYPPPSPFIFRDFVFLLRKPCETIAGPDRQSNQPYNRPASFRTWPLASSWVISRTCLALSTQRTGADVAWKRMFVSDPLCAVKKFRQDGAFLAPKKKTNTHSSKVCAKVLSRSWSCSGQVSVSRIPIETRRTTKDGEEKKTSKRVSRVPLRDLRGKKFQGFLSGTSGEKKKSKNKIKF